MALVAVDMGVQSLALELSHAVGGEGRQKKKKKRERERERKKE